MRIINPEVFPSTNNDALHHVRTVPALAMKDLLPHYEQELILLRQRAAEFAQRFPGPASRLQIVGASCGDPHVERLLQGTALLTARVHKSLKDGYGRFTESFLEVLFPHYLRPFPSCAIVQARHPDAGRGLVIPRGTDLHAKPAGDVVCRFKTCYDIRQLPVSLPQVRFVATLAVPPLMRVPTECGASVAIDIESAPQQRGFATLAGSTLRVYLDGAPSLVAVVRDLLHSQVRAACIESTNRSVARSNTKRPITTISTGAGKTSDCTTVTSIARTAIHCGSAT